MVAFSRRHFWRTNFSASTANVDHFGAILSIPNRLNLKRIDRLDHPRPLSAEYESLCEDEDASAYDLQRRVIEVFRALGIDPTDDELDELVISRAREKGAIVDQLDELTIKECGGPAEAAKAVLSRASHLSTGTLAKAKRLASLIPQRTVFGRWVTPVARDAYLRELLDSEREKGRATPSVSVGSVRAKDEATGRTIDSSVERLTRTLFTTDEGLMVLFGSEPVSARMRELQHEFGDDQHRTPREGEPMA